MLLFWKFNRVEYFNIEFRIKQKSNEATTTGAQLYENIVMEIDEYDNFMIEYTIITRSEFHCFLFNKKNEIKMI